MRRVATGQGGRKKDFFLLKSPQTCSVGPLFSHLTSRSVFSRAEPLPNGVKTLWFDSCACFINSSRSFEIVGGQCGATASEKLSQERLQLPTRR